MTTTAIQDLRKLRQKLTDERRAMAKSGNADRTIELQSRIEALDRAVADEIAIKTAEDAMPARRSPWASFGSVD